MFPSLRRVTKIIQTTTGEYLYAISVVSYIVPLLTTGYRSGSNRTIMFTLMAMIQKQFALNRKLYVAFIDFEKAFDSISR